MSMIESREPNHKLTLQNQVTTSQEMSVAVDLKGFAETTTPGEVRIQIWDKKARLKRATKFWGAFWLMALVSVFIPGLHFILVPALLIIGPMIAWTIYQQDRVILGGEGKCPDCGATLQIARAQDHWPLSDLCTQCYRTVKIQKRMP